ncbi:hypothetical protein L2750_15490 [Shewanella submarina]|uniref:Uncharacterized protein n=1 Tax=Shewanella submarina TaxID=2016376 RepID=A0ABV7G5S9_9GAMM|nr:hypothetical protein [Shewanella submarina]MCL1038537.1 hypothetical protein [Shewanella submarina]
MPEGLPVNVRFGLKLEQGGQLSAIPDMGKAAMNQAHSRYPCRERQTVQTVMDPGFQEVRNPGKSSVDNCYRSRLMLKPNGSWGNLQFISGA